MVVEMDVGLEAAFPYRRTNQDRPFVLVLHSILYLSKGKVA